MADAIQIPVQGTVELCSWIEAHKDTIFLSGQPERSMFNIYLDAALEKNLAPDKYYNTIYRLQKYFDALVHLRADEFNMYSQLMHEADDCKEPGDELCNTVVHSFACAAIAFEKYKYKDYDAATKLVAEAFITDEELQQQGLDVQYYHKIQLMHNLAKVLDRQDETDGHVLLQAIMDLLVAHKDLTFQHYTIPHRDNSSYGNTINAFFFQVGNELLKYCMRLRNKDKQAYGKAVAAVADMLGAAGDSLIDCKEQALQMAQILRQIDISSTVDDIYSIQPALQNFLLADNVHLLVHKVFVLSHYEAVLSNYDMDGAAKLKGVLNAIPSVRAILPS